MRDIFGGDVNFRDRKNKVHTMQGGGIKLLPALNVN